MGAFYSQHVILQLMDYVAIPSVKKRLGYLA